MGMHTAYTMQQAYVQTGRYLGMIQQAARRSGLPWRILRAQIEQESGGYPDNESRDGAYGIAQLMPGTARQWRVDRSNPAQSISAMARYDHRNLVMADHILGPRHNWRQALSMMLRAYNAGPHAVRVAVRRYGPRHYALGLSMQARNYPQRVYARLRFDIITESAPCPSSHGPP